MKKLGLICIAFLVAFALTGAGYAWWSDTLAISGQMTVGAYDAVFYAAASNDLPGSRDPVNPGIWRLNAFNNPIWSGVRSTTVTVGTTDVNNPGTKTAYVQFSQPYGGYSGSAGFTVKNTGTVPIKIKTVSIAKSATGSDSAASKLTVITGNVLDETMHFRINPGEYAAGYVRPIFAAGVESGAVYMVTVTITVVPWNE